MHPDAAFQPIGTENLSLAEAGTKRCYVQVCCSGVMDCAFELTFCCKYCM